MYRAGDIIVTPIPNGYMVGRLLARPEPGPWWEQVQVEADFYAAVGVAQELAAREGQRAWVYESARKFREITRPSG